MLVLQGFPCSWGRCTFCPFGLEQSVNISEVIEKNRGVIREALKLLDSCRPTRVSVFNGSSFYELPVDTLAALRPLTEGRVVDIEVRPEYVTLDTLKWTIEVLGAKMLVVRVGFEVWDEKLRNEYLRKGIPQSEVQRVAQVAREAKLRGLPVKMLVYVLFGIEGVPEEEVIRSVREYNKLFDGVIAVRYHRYHPRHPRETRVSKKLAEFLETNTVLVDWGEEPEWEIAGKKPGISD
ncbi:hypothetical protein Pyrfu_1802 [Pyrolobus fumarii 1A]|uniref:Radical SAM domain protein n=1 Tax=Pyrolobus fumarii (strain DSM 11204 / 1A) TaxID=694429 RepID=G0ECT6_PYRF1|nr:hypothetical protein [Pyrolobus fumarii]AEM39656.1 hypothetical protein Pyrfu_1802 [Pyrolobus fumarii 1A]